jgi:hypothetical protein
MERREDQLIITILSPVKYLDRVQCQRWRGGRISTLSLYISQWCRGQCRRWRRERTSCRPSSSTPGHSGFHRQTKEENHSFMTMIKYVIIMHDLHAVHDKLLYFTVFN